MKEIMTTKNKRWKEFLERLKGKEGCNFREEEPDNFQSLIWDCSGGRDKTLATKILKKMNNINLNASLYYYEENGGYCDCEILINVA